MHTSFLFVTTLAACSLLVTRTSAQSAADIRGASPLIEIKDEPPARLIVDERHKSF